PSRLFRARSRAVAPMPPQRTKPAPSAPTASTGSFPRSVLATSVAFWTSARSVSTDVASCDRSDSISRRTSSAERSGCAAIAAQDLLCPLCLIDRLLRDRRRTALEWLDGDERQNGDDEQQHASDDEQRRPGRQDGVEARSAACEREAERVEQQDGGGNREA